MQSIYYKRIERKAEELILRRPRTQWCTGRLCDGNQWAISSLFSSWKERRPAFSVREAHLVGDRNTTLVICLLSHQQSSWHPDWQSHLKWFSMGWGAMYGTKCGCGSLKKAEWMLGHPYQCALSLSLLSTKMVTVVLCVLWVYRREFSLCLHEFLKFLQGTCVSYIIFFRL